MKFIDLLPNLNFMNEVYLPVCVPAHLPKVSFLVGWTFCRQIGKLKGVHGKYTSWGSHVTLWVMVLTSVIFSE